MRQGNLIVLFCSRNNGSICFNWCPPVPRRTYPSASCLIPPFFATSNQNLHRFWESEEIKSQTFRDTQSNCGHKSFLAKLADLRVKNKAPGFLKNYSSSSNIPGGKLAVWDEHMHFEFLFKPLLLIWLNHTRGHQTPSHNTNQVYHRQLHTCLKPMSHTSVWIESGKKELRLRMLIR